MNYVTEAISQIQSFYLITPRGEDWEALLLLMMYFKRQNLTEIHHFCSDIGAHLAGGGRTMCCQLHPNPLVREFQHYLPFQGLLGGEEEEEEVCYSLHQEFNL